ncbi:MAG: class II aldolase/adducin family protein [Armatimonadetes bacterium]|nr:class II aldolase/adducin family protein [Anaerolineae bacterium]
MSESLNATRVALADTAARLFARQLLDLAGGNLSVRLGEIVCITPRYSGLRHHWALTPDDVMVVTLDGTIIEGKGELSRESRVHLSLHRAYGEHGTAVIHAHARNVMVFAAHARPMPVVLEATRKFGEIQVVDFAPSHSADLAQHVTNALSGQEARINKHAAAVIAPYHGLFAMGRDLDLAADAVERLDTNAYCLLMGSLLPADDAFQSRRDAMEAAIEVYDQHKAHTAL